MYALLHQRQLKQSQVTFSSVNVPAVLLVASAWSCLGNQVWELTKDKNTSKFLTAGSVPRSARRVLFFLSHCANAKSGSDSASPPERGNAQSCARARCTPLLCALPFLPLVRDLPPLPVPH